MLIDPLGSPRSSLPTSFRSGTGEPGRPAGTKSPPAPSSVRCSTDAPPGSQLPPAGVPESVRPRPSPPRGRQSPARAALTLPHHRLQPRGRHLPPGPPPPPLPGLSQGGGVASCVLHAGPAPAHLAPPPVGARRGRSVPRRADRRMRPCRPGRSPWRGAPRRHAHRRGLRHTSSACVQRESGITGQ